MRSGFGATDVDQTINQSTSALKRISDGLFAGGALLWLIVAIILGSIIGKLLSLLLLQVSRAFGASADASANLMTVNRLRRYETWTILSAAIIRVLALVAALYFWWIFVHPNGQPQALVGASALLIIIIGGMFGPLLRDFAFGTGMMAEHWFGVGDLVTIEPYTLQGVVERITLRSTRIRGLNGEVIWVSNQNISSVNIAQKGVIPLAIELFVNDKKRAEKLVEQVNALLPTGPSLLVSPLTIMDETERSEGLWHLTVLAETAPGRNWLIERSAIDLLKDIDAKSSKPVLVTEPVARYADNDTEREFARAVKNAKKSAPTRRPRTPRAKKTPAKR